LAGISKFYQLFCRRFFQDDLPANPGTPQTRGLEKTIMADFDAGFKIVARHAGRGLTRMAGFTVDQWEAIGDTLQTTERLADRVFRARNGKERFIVYMEAYTRWVESAVWSVLAKSGLLSERERLPTRSLIFVLLPQAYQEQQGQFRLQVAGEPTQQIWFREICLWKQQPEPWWEHQPGLMALFPLCQHGMELPQALIHAAGAIRRRELDSARRADLLTTLGIFGKLKNRGLDALSIIGREQMRESPLYQEIMEEGRQLNAREDVLQVLTLRFGAEAAKEFEDGVNRIDNLEQLKELHKIAVQSRRISQFRRALTAL
jgi:hypothetical protein